METLLENGIRTLLTFKATHSDNSNMNWNAMVVNDDNNLDGVLTESEIYLNMYLRGMYNYKNILTFVLHKNDATYLYLCRYDLDDFCFYGIYYRLNEESKTYTKCGYVKLNTWCVTTPDSLEKMNKIIEITDFFENQIYPKNKKIIKNMSGFNIANVDLLIKDLDKERNNINKAFKVPKNELYVRRKKERNVVL